MGEEGDVWLVGDSASTSSSKKCHWLTNNPGKDTFKWRRLRLRLLETKIQIHSYPVVCNPTNLRTTSSSLRPPQFSTNFCATETRNSSSSFLLFQEDFFHHYAVLAEVRKLLWGKEDRIFGFSHAHNSFTEKFLSDKELEKKKKSGLKGNDKAPGAMFAQSYLHSFLFPQHERGKRTRRRRE